MSKRRSLVAQKHKREARTTSEAKTFTCETVDSKESLSRALTETRGRFGLEAAHSRLRLEPDHVYQHLGPPLSHITSPFASRFSGTPIPVLSPAPSSNPPITVPGTTPPGTVPLAITVPLSTLSNVIQLSTGQIMNPAPDSQMVRTVQRMMTSLPRTLDTTPAYKVSAPADLGTMVLNPPIGEFINTNQWRLGFQLTGASAAACVNTPCGSTCQVRSTHIRSVLHHTALWQSSKGTSVLKPGLLIST